MHEPNDNAANEGNVEPVSIGQFQRLIREMYFEKDQARGIPATFLWLTEEIGELASALRETEHAQEQANQKPSDVAIGKDLAAKRKNLGEEFADVFAWLATIANVAEIDLSNVLMDKYGSGCPGCRNFICVCPDEEKP